METICRQVRGDTCGAKLKPNSFSLPLKTDVGEDNSIRLSLKSSLCGTTITFTTRILDEYT